MSPTIDLTNRADQQHIEGKTIGAMLSCLVDATPKSMDQYGWLSATKSTLTVVRSNCSDGYNNKTKLSRIQSAVAKTPAVDKNSFLKGFGLLPAQLSQKQRESSRNLPVDVDYNVIVIEDDDEDDQISYQQDGSLGLICSLNGALGGVHEASGSTSTRSLQPSSRLRKLLSIDVSSPLGSRMLGYVTATLRNDGLVLNPFTVSHSLAGSDTALDYGMFCRTPVKGTFNGRLRQRDFPVKYRRLPSAGTHCHYYCFGRSDRRKFCRRFDSGLSRGSYLMRKKCGRCCVLLEQLTTAEITDWRSSQRLRDYVEKFRQSRVVSSAQAAANDDDDIICVSSDSEDERSVISEPQDLVFRCHQCDVKLSCVGSFRTLVRDHYSSCHGINNIDIINIPQADGTTAMQIVHVPMRSIVAPNSVTGTPANGPSISRLVSDGNNLYISQADTSVVPKVGNLVSGTWVPSSLQPVNITPISRQLLSSTSASLQPVRLSISPLPRHVLANAPASGEPACRVALQNIAPDTRPVALFKRKVLLTNPSILRRSNLCAGDTTATAVRSNCDDVICLD